MQRVIINEQDLTSSSVTIETTDVVFVPGFSTADGPGAAKPLIPTLCSSVDEFNSAFGSVAPTFEDAQYYPEARADTYGFSANAIPVVDGIGEENDTPWFTAGAVDPSYIYAKELVSAGIPVVYCRVNGGEKASGGVYGITVADMYDALLNKVFAANTTGEKIYTEESDLLNKDYQIKYITSGGYPTFEYGKGTDLTAIANKMTYIARVRGDAVALIDHTDCPDRALVGNTSVFYVINHSGKISDGANQDSYGEMYTPWATYATTLSYGNAENIVMPGSFAYLTSLAKSIKTNANWLAIAGATRGLVPGIKELHINKLLTNNIAESYQPETGTCINAITRIRPYGLCIWGNRTLKNQVAGGEGFATRFANLRSLISDVKKQAFVAAQSLMFEQNNDILWINFKALLTPLLDQMVSGYGIKTYKIIKNESGEDRTKLNATIRIYPVYAVESFEIGIVLTDEDVEVAE